METRSTRRDGKAAQKRRSAEEEARRKEILKESLREKLELERRALQVVERLLDDRVTEEFLIDCVRLITSANYRDAIEERSIAKMCGYPVCPNKLLNVPTQQFKISTKTNKVYDITERKCFCTNFCYKASKYLEVQISRSPLWLRKEEERSSEVKLLKKGDGGTSGLEVRLSGRPVCASDVENPIPESHRGTSDGECSGAEEEEEEQEGFVSSVVSRPQHGRRRVHWGDLPGPQGDPRSARAGGVSVEDAGELLEQVAISDSDEISRVGMSRRTAAGLRNLLRSQGRAPALALSLVEGLSRTLTEWRTQETTRFLYGADPASHAELQGDDDDDDDGDDQEELDEDDLEDVDVAKGSGDGGSGGGAPNPAPDYETLRRDAQTLQLQVQEFYRGVCVLPEEVHTHTEDARNAPPLPLVDSRAQRAIRRRIVVEKLCRSLRDTVGPLGVTMSEIINDVNAVVRTFRLTNVNIIHKPPEWTLIGVILLSVLAEVSPSLRESMTRTCSLDYISSLMKELGLKDEDLRSLVKLLGPPRKSRSERAATKRRGDS